MKNATRIGILGIVLASIVAADGPADAVTLKAIKYDDLSNAVRLLRGKVIVVDFWADYCVPCKREFPRLVELQRKYAQAGLTAVSVSLDENTEAKRQAIGAFLKKQGATFTNILLDETPTLWQAKLKINGPPLVFVFNRKGELVKRFEDEGVDFDKINALVATLLKD